MVFSSITFLYYFLPAMLVLYFIAPKSMKNKVLLLGSLVFYGWGEPKYIVLIVISIMAGYFAGIMIDFFMSKENKKHARYTLFATLILLVGNLIYFKFANHFPIGISFYTFQIISYIVDVYRKNVQPQKSVVNLALYVAMFPQLIAGPIVRYKDIESQLTDRKHSADLFAAGICRFVIGLGKKVLLANSLGELCMIFKESDGKAVLFFWLYAVSFALQVYFDFSGYSDMAIGLGKMFGFNFMENFRYPYISRSVTEFWRRWHISLGQWFRDYVYIPLGGNRVSKGRWIFNIFIVWILTGFWHGAQWNFIVWGLLFAVFLIAEKRWLSEFLSRHNIISHFYLLFVVLIGFVIFNAADMKEAIDYIGAMFGVGTYPMISNELIYYLKSYTITLIAATIGTTPFGKIVWKNISEKHYGKIASVILEPVGLFVILLLVTAYLVDGSFNPFLYFRF